MLTTRSDRSSPSRPRHYARTAALAVCAIAAFGGTAVGAAQAKPIGPCDGPCPPVVRPPAPPKPQTPKSKLVKVYTNTFAYSTPYPNARHRKTLRRGVYVATCEAKSVPAGRYNNPWWSRLRDGSWVNNGSLSGGVKMGIGDCPPPRNDGAVPKPLPVCVVGKYQTKYLGARRRHAVDHSILRLSWQPNMCKDQSGQYRTIDPTLEVIGPGHLGVGLELRAAERTSRNVTYRGDIRECTPFSVGYKGIGFSGKACRTIGRAQITATATASGTHVAYQAWRLKHASRGYGEWVWTDRPI